jgi:predicted DsbA family dithiol-disulfide isomerase
LYSNAGSRCSGRRDRWFGRRRRRLCRCRPQLADVSIRKSTAEAGGLQGHFWEMHDLLYGSQLVWTRAADARDLFDQFAKSIGLDVERFKADMESQQVKARIIADQQRAASLGVNRTPAIFINGKRLPNSLLNQKALLGAIERAVNPKAG